MSARALVVAALVCSCANAGSGDFGPKSDAPVQHDAPMSSIDAPLIDAPGPLVDASVDAFVPPPPPDAMPDSGGGSGLFCAGNSECTTAGECCLVIGGVGLCTPGTIVFGTCLPI
jgi:hypothetical protein